MRIKKLITTLALGVALTLGIGVGVASGVRQNVKEAKADGSITIYVDGLSNYSMSEETPTPMHLSLDNSTWVNATWTSGAEYNNVGQFKYVFTAESSTSLYCYFTTYENDTYTYWHPTGGTQWDTNYSSLGTVSLTSGNSYVITVTGFEYGYDNNEHKWFNFTVTQYETPDTCLIYGTWADGESGSSIGNYNNGQFEITNLHLITTDSIYFSIDGWFDVGGYSMINGDGASLFDSSETNLVPLANGYYNFYIQKTVMYVTQTEVEDVDDGVYLRYSTDNMTTNVIKFTTTTEGLVYTLSNYSLVAGISYKAVKYVDGLKTWCEINAVTCSDSTYFNVSASGGNALVSKKGIYKIVLTLSGSTWNYAFTDTASIWCEEFLDSMTCTNNGTAEPVFKTGYSWAILGTSYSVLDDDAKDAIAGATANKSGTVIQEAASRYDTIVANHGYSKFIVDSSDVSRSSTSINNVYQITDNTNMVLVIVIISSISLIAAGAYLLLKKKKHN